MYMQFIVCTQHIIKNICLIKCLVYFNDINKTFSWNLKALYFGIGHISNLIYILMTNWNGKSRKVYIKTRTSLISFMTKFLKWYLLYIQIYAKDLCMISEYKNGIENSRVSGGSISWKYIKLGQVKVDRFFRINSSSYSNVGKF